MSKYSILLVEDEVHLHDALKLNLELEGYEVSSAFDGPDALRQIGQAHFDLIIMDRPIRNNFKSQSKTPIHGLLNLKFKKKDEIFAGGICF